VVLIEDKASGTRLIHELVADGLRAVTAAEQDHVHAGQTRVRLDLVAPGRPIVFYGVLDIIKSYFSRRERRRYWGAKGTNLISSRAGACAPAVFQQGFWFTPQADPEVWNQRNDPLSIVAADIGLPELSSIVICSSVPT